MEYLMDNIEREEFYIKLIRELTRKIIDWDYEFQDMGILKDLDIDYDIIKVTNEECGDVLLELTVPDVEEPFFYLIGKIYRFLHELPTNAVLPPADEIEETVKQAIEHNYKIYICRKIF